MDIQLRNLIAKNNIIDSELCDSIVEKSKEMKWQPHQWYSHHDDYTHSHEKKELDVCYGKDIPSVIQQQLLMHVNHIWNSYMNILPELLNHNHHDEGDVPNMNAFNMIKYWSEIRFNRYSEGTMMRPHYDHIQSLFDGERRGVPVLSIIGALNDCTDYEGGALKFWNNFEIEMKKGDILIFPSCYLYPHGVEEVTKGERYTFVSWGF